MTVRLGQVVQETWFILVLGGVLLTMLVLLVAALLVRRRWARKKALSTAAKTGVVGDLTAPLNCGSGAGAEDAAGRLWSRGWHSHAATTNLAGKEAELETSLLPQYANSMARGVPPPEYAELLNHCNQVRARWTFFSFEEISLSFVLERIEGVHSNMVFSC